MGKSERMTKRYRIKNIFDVAREGESYSYITGIDGEAYLFTEFNGRIISKVKVQHLFGVVKESMDYYFSVWKELAKEKERMIV